MIIHHRMSNHHGLTINCERQQDQSRYIKSQSKESDVASDCCKVWRVESPERDSLQERSCYPLEPATFGTIQTRQQYMFEDESRAEQNCQAAQEPARVE